MGILSRLTKSTEHPSTYFRTLGPEVYEQDLPLGYVEPRGVSARRSSG